jgi:hypothetical protein
MQILTWWGLTSIQRLCKITATTKKYLQQSIRNGNVDKEIKILS